MVDYDCMKMFRSASIAFGCKLELSASLIFLISGDYVKSSPQMICNNNYEINGNWTEIWMLTPHIRGEKLELSSNINAKKYWSEKPQYYLKQVQTLKHRPTKEKRITKKPASLLHKLTIESPMAFNHVYNYFNVFYFLN